MKTLDGKVILVTGGARGLGEAICRELSDAGAQVIIADIRTDLANQVAQDLRGNGREPAVYELDITSEEAVKQAFERIRKDYGCLDGLVNSAGTDKTVSIEELDVEDWDMIMAVNLRAPYILSKLALPLMREQGGGTIINIISTAAKRAWANASVYHASKWGLLGFSHALHVEGRPHNIKVTALLPGGMRTPFLLDRFPDLDVNNLQDPKNVAEIVRFLMQQPDGSVIPEIMVLPMRESSWP
jgi:NAD(P)-dependent dehydrogenase (short-subunit alcohol dehydrogenase family)